MINRLFHYDHETFLREKIEVLLDNGGDYEKALKIVQEKPEEDKFWADEIAHEVLSTYPRYLEEAKRLRNILLEEEK